MAPLAHSPLKSSSHANVSPANPSPPVMAPPSHQTSAEAGVGWGGGAAPPSWGRLRFYNPGNVGCQPSTRQQVRPSCFQIWVCDLFLALDVPHLGNTGKHSLHSDRAVLDGLRVLELKETHLMKQANS